MLTEFTIKNAKPAAKSFYLADAHSLSLFIKPNGSRLWRCFRFHGMYLSYCYHCANSLFGHLRPRFLDAHLAGDWSRPSCGQS
jgi:hypothetical protein